VQLSSATYSVNENGGTVTITATRSGGSYGAASVNYATANGTATAGSDYTAKSGTLNWSDGDAANKTFTVTILDNVVCEGNKTFAVNLSGATGASLGSPTSVTVTILDDENNWDSGCQDLGNGWRRLSWFGDYIPLANNWIWHKKLGYMYVAPSSTPQSIYFWNTAMSSWWWTSSAFYSYIYRFSDRTWLWYQSGSTGPCWFLNLSTWGWESW
jgi:hypothetical protein